MTSIEKHRKDAATAIWRRSGSIRAVRFDATTREWCGMDDPSGDGSPDWVAIKNFMEQSKRPWSFFEQTSSGYSDLNFLQHLSIVTAQGEKICRQGDWIVDFGDGEFDVFTDFRFKELFEPANAAAKRVR